MATSKVSSTRRRLDVVEASYHPRYVVWELTLRCDQPCTHCGSRAGAARKNELSTDEALRVVTELHDMGAEEIVLIGGEAYLHPGYLEIARAIKSHGMRPTMTTGGRGVEQAMAHEMARAGFELVSVSIDGLEKSHDLVRAARGSFSSATKALGYLKEAGIETASNTNVNRVNIADLEGIYDHLRDLGVTSWQIQLTVPLGRAADRPDMILQPYDLVDLFPRIANIKKRAFADGVKILSANNLGYFGPEEGLLRSPSESLLTHFQGCIAGKYGLGIESDGAVKGCPSLQSDAYVGGNVREHSIRKIWDESPELGFARIRSKDDLWGFCATCDFAEPCLAGCTFTAHALLGRPGNNPYCRYRASRMMKLGLRERLVPIERAPGVPFDNGRFDIVVEPFDSKNPPDKPPTHLVQVRTKK